MRKTGTGDSKPLPLATYRVTLRTSEAVHEMPELHNANLRIQGRSGIGRQAASYLAATSARSLLEFIR